jgi:microcystin-dependent protein
VPAGWLLCDGSFVLCTDLPDLFAAIGFAHGETADQLNFALPDYRGLFLRGVSGSSDADPDAANRMPMGNAGGNTGNAVGSVQWFETLSHQHSVGEGVGDSTTMVLGGGTTNRLASFATDQWNGPGQLWTGHRGGNETRPKNAYVNFLIKT